MPQDSLLYRIAITLIPGIGNVNAKKLIAWCGGAEAVFRESRKNLQKIPLIGRQTVELVLKGADLSRAEREIRFIEENNIQPLWFLDEDYPQRLKMCDDGPVLLYYKGTADLNARRVLGVVGTRKATHYGREMTRKILEELAGLDVLIVSGLAYGIDTYAHREAINNGLPTVGVLGHGFDRIYPAKNRKLAAEMENGGGLVTEFLSGTIPDRENFPRRNRIIAGMCDAVLVVESAAKGGALITANIAASYNRDVFAVPGRVHDPYSEGCNFLIKTNKAALVGSGKDICYQMNWNAPSVKTGKQTRLFRPLSPDEAVLMKLLEGGKPVSIDELVMKSGFTPSQCASLLLQLEFDGMVSSLPGKVYVAV
ncbi:MAG: DNA-processing protein DprA [Bacteroidales bacterium]